ncbi:Gfo/Idh/MocA family oxidoreductase [Thalassospira alkalitolerans]|uniref:Gfo/Idh/MocA family protein n=1 Tax=Thalassospira alkalitolerans TaxID=1293890 RepID=UPI0030EF6A69
MKRKLRAGVIGLGVGEQHAKGYLNSVGAELVAVCDLDPDRLLDVNTRLGNVEAYTDWHRITEHPNIDVVSICGYDDGHFDQCISAFRHGKHVMVEKPACLTRIEAENMLREQQDSGLSLTSNLILRKVPRFIELREKISSGAYGEIFCVEGGYIHDILWKITKGWRGDMDFYSTMLGGGIHLIDLMRWMINDEIEEVACFANKVLTRETTYKFSDTYLSSMRFRRGALGKCLATYGPRRTKFHELNVYGTSRTFVNGIPDATEYFSDKPEDAKIVTTPYPGVGKDGFIDDFVASIQAGQKPSVDEKDIFRMLDVCFAILDAEASGCKVKVNYLI